MGRKANNHGQKHRNQTAYLVKIRIPGNRIKEDGTIVQGGRILGRNIFANNPEHAKSRCENQGLVVSVRKTQPEYLLGDLKKMHLEDVIGVINVEKKKVDVILDNVSLSEIVFGRKKHQEEEQRHINRRFNNQNGRTE